MGPSCFSRRRQQRLGHPVSRIAGCCILQHDKTCREKAHKLYRRASGWSGVSSLACERICQGNLTTQDRSVGLTWLPGDFTPAPTPQARGRVYRLVTFPQESFGVRRESTVVKTQSANAAQCNKHATYCPCHCPWVGLTAGLRSRFLHVGEPW
jgi:hypothetical protein